MTYSLCYCTVVIKGPSRILDIIHRNKLRISRKLMIKESGNVPDIFDYELKERRPNEIKIGFIVNHSCTPEFLINDLVLKFPCCSACVRYVGDWDEGGNYEVCSDSKNVYIINNEYGSVYDYYQKEEDEWDGEFAVASLLEDNYLIDDGQHESIEEYILSNEEEEYYNTKHQEADEEEKADAEWMADFYTQLSREENYRRYEKDFEIHHELKIPYNDEITKDDKEAYYIYEEGLDYYLQKEIVIWLNKYKNMIKEKNLQKLERLSS